MILNIPISAIPNQSLNVVLNNQNCTIDLLSRDEHVFFNLFLNNVNIIYGRKLNLTKILPYLYLQDIFNGNLILVNNDGNTRQVPDYKLFGITQSLLYYDASSASG